MNLRPTSVRARLTLWYTLSLSIPLIAFAIISYMTFAATLLGRTDAFVRDGLTVFIREVGFERSTLASSATAIQATVAEVRFQDLDIAVLDDNGSVIAMSSPVHDPATSARHALPGDSSVLLPHLRAHANDDSWTGTLHARDRSFRVLMQPLHIDGVRHAVAAVYPLLEVHATLQRIREMFIFAIPLLIASAATGGYFLARRSLAPVSAMTTRAADIGATNLHERLPVAAADELGALANVLNDLLDRLERSFAQQRRFMADASHELRTPSAILRAEADVTLSRPHRTEDEYRESMTVVQDAARRLTRIVDDIFLIARADAGHLVMQTADIALEDVVHDAVRALRPVAERRGVNLLLDRVVDAPVRGDPDLLGRVLLNLIDNAIKHTPAGGQVSVGLAPQLDAWAITVRDDGTGIPADVQARIFERFFRADPARARAESTTSGAGLGLPIARFIAEMHNGSLTLVHSEPGHTEFRLILPDVPSVLYTAPVRL